MNMFSRNAKPRIKRNKFNLSHEKKMSMNMGLIYPILAQETLPGDSFRVNSEVMMRLSPMIAPMLHRVNVYTHYFFVPNRLIWDDWESFITGGKDGDEFPTAPYIYMDSENSPYFGKKTLADYMGLPIPPTTVTQGFKVSALPFRAYQTIWNEYFRDQNLTNPTAFSTASGEITDLAEVARLTELRKRAWEKDYFTSALPWSQRSQDEVELPTDIRYRDEAKMLNARGTTPPYDNSAAGPASFLANQDEEAQDQTTLHSTGMTFGAMIDNIESLGITINDLRRSNKLQEWLERQARGGARLTEMILSHFGVRSSDQRLQRPEYLSGGRTPITVSEVLQNSTSGYESSPTSLTPQGNMAGHGIAVGNSNRFKRRFEEHGFVIGLISVLPKTAYQDGINKMWTREDKFDYYWPEFAHLGEQEVLNQEIYADFNEATPAQGQETFGYQSRGAEYKYGVSTVHGDFRDDLAFWHMGRQFTTKPALNASFVEADPTTRIFAITDEEEDKIYAQIYNNISALRPMPYFGTPRL